MDADEDGFVSPEDLTVWFFKLEQEAQGTKREFAKVAQLAAKAEDMTKTQFMGARGAVAEKQPIFASKVDSPISFIKLFLHVSLSL